MVTAAQRKEVRAEQPSVGKRAVECSSHRLRMTSSEVIYGTEGGYGDPVKTIYTFKCSGSCGLVTTLTVKN